jgi:hypothetical protein
MEAGREEEEGLLHCWKFKLFLQNTTPTQQHLNAPLQYENSKIPLPGLEQGLLVDTIGGEGLNLLTVQPGSMEEGMLCEHFSKHECLKQPLLNPCCKYIGLLYAFFLIAE